MSKKNIKAPRQRDKHSKSHRKHKRDHEKVIEEIDVKKLRIDKNACGDCPEPQIHPDTAKKPKRSKEKDRKSIEIEKGHAKNKISNKTNNGLQPKATNDKAVRHHSLEKAEPSFLDKTRLLFRKEKSFNDALQKSINVKDGKNENKKRHNHRSRKVKETVEDQVVRNNEKVHKSKHKSKEKTPLINEGFGRVQEVIFCQMTQPPYKMKNDKTGSEVKDLYRRIQKDERRHRSNSGKKVESPDPRLRHRHGESSKKTSKPFEASEQYITQLQYADFNCKAKPNKSPDSFMRKHHTFDPSKISLGPYEKFFAFEKAEEHNNQSSGKSVEKRHHHEGKGKVHVSKHKRQSPEKLDFRNEASQAEEQKMHQMIEGDLKNYLGKIQTLIDKKLDAFMQLNRCRSKRKSDKTRSKSKTKEEHVDTGKKLEEKAFTNEEIINEVLNRLKKEGQAKLSVGTQLKTSEQKSSSVDKEELPKVTKKRHTEKTGTFTKPDVMLRRPIKAVEGYAKFPHKQFSKPDDLLLRPYTSEFRSCKSGLQEYSHLFRCLQPSASEATVRPKHHDGGRRSSSPGRIVDSPKSQHNKDSSLSPEPFLREIFSPPESFRCSTNICCNHQKHDFIVQGIEPPILECAKKKSRRTIPVRRLECKTVSIVSIQPKPEVKEVIRTQTSGKSHKSSLADRDLVEKKKNSKRFKLYYNYSTADNTADQPEAANAVSDAGSIISDSGRLVSDPSEEKLVTVPLAPKIWNQAPSPRNSHLNNIIEEPSQVSTSTPTQDFFIPLACTKQFYCRVLTSSHSDYCLKVDKKNLNSDLSLQSRVGCGGRFIYYEDGKCRYYKAQKSKSDFKLFPDTHNKQQLIRSTLNPFIDENRIGGDLKGIFQEEQTNRKQKPLHYSAFKTVLDEELLFSCCKECQTEANESSAEKIIRKSRKQFREINGTIDCLEEDISLRSDHPITVDVGVSCLKVSEQREVKEPHNKSANKKISQKSLDVGVDKCEGTQRVVLDAAVGCSEEKLEAKIRPPPLIRKPPAKQAKQCKYTRVSPIRLTEEAAVQVQPPSPRRKPWTPSKPRPRKPRQILEKSPTPRVVDPKKVPQSTNKLKPSAWSPVKKITPTFKEVDASETCVKVFRSLEKNGKSSSAFEEVFKAKDTHGLVDKSQRAESCFHSYETEPRRISRTAPPPSKLGPVIVSTATYSCQHSEKAERSTSSSVSDASNGRSNQVRKSKSLVEVKTSLNIQSRSKAGCAKSVEDQQSFMGEDLEKFCNKPRLHCSSKSHGSSLEHYIGDKFASRLLLTKDYKGGQVSAYQKRKLYDLERRQKTKRNYRFSKNMDVGPQVFEVRFLSMMNQQSNNSIDVHRRAFGKPDTSIDMVGDSGVESGWSKKLERVNSSKKEDTKLSDPNNQLAVCLYAGENRSKKEYKPSEFSLDSTCQQQGLLELLCQQLQADEKLIKTCSCQTTQQCPTCKKLLAVMDKLYPTLNKYRQTEDKAQDYTPDCVQRREETSDRTVNKNPPLEVEDIFATPFNQISSDSDNNVELASVETAEKLHFPVLTQPISCPILTTNSPSFEFLYEENSSLDAASRDALYSNLVQTINFNTSQFNLKAPLLQVIKEPKSRAASIESGYASIKSKSRCSNSLTKFFKKPNIIALFKAPRRSALNLEAARSELGAEDNLYQEMTKSCQLYAKKVRARGDIRLEENLGEYKEFSLQFLLGDNGSIVLESNALSMRSVSSDMGSQESTKMFEGDCPRNSVDDDGKDCCSILSEKANPNICELIVPASGCKLILINQCLKTQNTAFLAPDVFGFRDTKPFTHCQSNSALNGEESYCVVDCGYSSNDSAPQEFFAALIKMYDNERVVCDKLYGDITFTRSIFAAVEEQKRTMKKMRRLCKCFTKKASMKGEMVQPNQQVYMDNQASKKLQELAFSTRRCFSMLADAVMANNNIHNELKICGLLKLLERLEKGDFHLIANEDKMDLEQEIRCQIKQAFISIYNISSKEAKKCKMRITDREMQLIMNFVIKFRIGLLSETDLVAVYIGRGIIKTEEHLKASVRYLLRSQKVNITEFEEYCKFD